MRATALLVALTTLSSEAARTQPSGPYTGPAPDLPFWRDVIKRAGETPLDPSMSAIRVVWAPEALIYAAVITIENDGEGALVRVRRLPDRRKAGASTSDRRIGFGEWEELRQLVDAGVWRQQPTAPTEAPPNMMDGVLWYAEATRGGLSHAISRHEPCNPDVVNLLSRVVKIAGMAEEQPHCPQ